MGTRQRHHPRGSIFRRASTTKEIVFEKGARYERPVMPRDETLASFRVVASLRRGAGVRQ